MGKNYVCNKCGAVFPAASTCPKCGSTDVEPISLEQRASLEARKKAALKIQVKANSQQGLPWADLEDMPDFSSYGQAHQWLVDSGAMKLTEYGLNFRIVPDDFPCSYTAALERNLASEAGRVDP